MNWQPIESASRYDKGLVWDGRRIEMAVRGRDAGWYVHGGIHGELVKAKPTHWMPLPEPPK